MLSLRSASAPSLFRPRTSPAARTSRFISSALALIPAGLLFVVVGGCTSGNNKNAATNMQPMQMSPEQMARTRSGR